MLDVETRAWRPKISKIQTLKGFLDFAMFTRADGYAFQCKLERPLHGTVNLGTTRIANNSTSPCQYDTMIDELYI